MGLTYTLVEGDRQSVTHYSKSETGEYKTWRRGAGSRWPGKGSLRRRRSIRDLLDTKERTVRRLPVRRAPGCLRNLMWLLQVNGEKQEMGSARSQGVRLSTVMWNLTFTCPWEVLGRERCALCVEGKGLRAQEVNKQEGRWGDTGIIPEGRVAGPSGSSRSTQIITHSETICLKSSQWEECVCCIDIKWTWECGGQLQRSQSH